MNRTDTFIRANNPTALGTPSDGGSPWVTQSGAWQLLSNQGASNNAAATNIATLDCGANDATLQATIATPGSLPGLCFRLQDANNYQEVQFNPGTAYVQEYIAGTPTTLASASFTLTPGDTVTVTCLGTAITIAVNGTTIITTTSSNLLSTTLFGLWAFFSNTTAFTALTITTGAPPPPSTNRGLIPNSFTYWEYRPAAGGELSRLSFWMEPRNVLLYDAAADAALIYLQAHTPAALQF